jgi:hypothetical protein
MLHRAKEITDLWLADGTDAEPALALNSRAGSIALREEIDAMIALTADDRNRELLLTEPIGTPFLELSWREALQIAQREPGSLKSGPLGRRVPPQKRCNTDEGESDGDAEAAVDHRAVGDHERSEHRDARRRLGRGHLFETALAPPPTNCH